MAPIGDGDGSYSPRDWKHDVFVSFRGKELRSNFASHFFRALEKSSIDCYRDDDVREIGEKIHPKLVVAIRRSRFSIALFSRKYGGSKWCLNELVEMLDFHKKNKHRGHVFMPVFYKVKTADVRKQTGKFGRCFEKHCEEICADGLQIETWRTALREAGATTGWRLDEWSEADFIDKIVDHLSKNVHCSRSPYLPKGVVPIKSQVDEVMSLLELSLTRCESPARVIGIYGNRGMGKTTLAGMVYDRVRFGFNGSTFLQLDDNENRENLVHLQRKLLLDVFEVNSQQFHDLRSNADEIKKKLRGRQLLLVLDNVTSKDQVRHFGVDGRGHWLSGGSRVIITTRHRHLLDELYVDEKYEVKKMCRRDSLRLFLHHVFSSDHPHEGFEELCESVLDIGNIRPSDLVDLASMLKGIVKERWSEVIEKWRKKRKVLCRDLVERVLSERPIPSSYASGSDAAYPIQNVGRMAFLLNPICDFVNNVSGARNGFATLLISRPEGQILTIPLPNLDKILDALPESHVEKIKPAKDWDAWMADKSMRRNDRPNTIRAWISLLKRMGIVETQTQAVRVTNEASPSRFTEEVEDPSNISQLVQNPLSSQEDRPATDPNPQVEDVLNEVKHMLLSEKGNPTPEAESRGTSGSFREYIPRLDARDEAAYPSPRQAPQIVTPGRVTPSDNDEDMDEGAVPEDFEPLPSCGFSLSFVLSQIFQASGFHLNLGFEKQVPKSPTVTTSRPRRISSMEKWRNMEEVSRNTASTSAHQSTVDSDAHIWGESSQHIIRSRPTHHEWGNLPTCEAKGSTVSRYF